MLLVVRRAFGEFLAIPTAIVGGFVLFAVLMVVVEALNVPGIAFLGDEMKRYVFTSPSSTASLMGTAATSIVTLTSITFSVLLLAVQQAGSTMTHAVFDQFLRRTSNQVYFGFFVGVALYALLILSVTGDRFNPVIGATAGLLLTLMALLLLIVLIYSTVNQMRPPVIVEAIHDNTLQAWQETQKEIVRTRRAARNPGPGHAVHASRNGYVVEIGFDAIAAALPDADAEVVVEACVGGYVTRGARIAELRAPGISDERARQVTDAVGRAFGIQRARSIQGDPSYGVEQLTNIGWTTMSGAKQNPMPGTNAINALRDLLLRFAAAGANSGEERTGDDLPIVYRRSLDLEVLDGLEELGLICCASLQGQNLAVILRSLAVAQDRLSTEARERAADISMRLLSAMGEMVATASLLAAWDELAAALESRHPREALALRAGSEQLTRSVGRLGARSTRLNAGR